MYASLRNFFLIFTSALKPQLKSIPDLNTTFSTHYNACNFKRNFFQAKLNSRFNESTRAKLFFSLQRLSSMNCDFTIFSAGEDLPHEEDRPGTWMLQAKIPLLSFSNSHFQKQTGRKPLHSALRILALFNVYQSTLKFISSKIGFRSSMKQNYAKDQSYRNAVYPTNIISC